MSNGRLTVWINGREVLPVRALPYVTGTQRFSPDFLARRFAECDPFGEKWPLKAYSVLGGDGFTVNRGAWDEVVARVDSFEIELKKMDVSNIAAYAVWRNGAAAALPASWFVYLDEFEEAVQADLNGIIFVGGPPNSGKLTLSPVIDVSTRAMVMEGFERFPEQNNSAESPSRLDEVQVAPLTEPDATHQPAPPLEPAATPQPAPPLEPEVTPVTKKTRVKRISENSAFLIDCDRKGVNMSIESIWLHIRDNAGKDNFLFRSLSKETATTVDGKSVSKKNLGRILREKFNAPKTSK